MTYAEYEFPDPKIIRHPVMLLSKYINSSLKVESMSNVVEIQNQISAAEAQIRQLREKLAAQKTEERRSAVSQAKALVKSHGISASELGLSAGNRRGSAKSAKAAKPGKTRAKVAAKYRDPATGNTWTGRGKTPNWLSARLASGKTKADYAV